MSREAKVAVEFTEVPPEFNGAMEVAWKRTSQLSWGMAPFMLEAMKPMLISIYLQGFYDGTQRTNTAKRAQPSPTE